MRRAGSWQQAAGRSALLIAAVAFFTTACGSDQPRLEGSLTEVLDLAYETADVLQADGELSVRFLRPQGAGEDVVLRLTVRGLGESGIAANETLDLTALDEAGNPRGVLSRSVLDDPLTQFPPLQRGQLTFKNDLASGNTVPGEFRVTFENGIELASGRTVFGTFEATVP